MTTKINFNSNIEDDAHISVFDHGFLFGDSVYEVLFTHHNKPAFFEDHFKRLLNSASGLSLTIPYDQNWFAREVDKTLQAAGNKESYVRIVVTRGIGDLDIDPSTCQKPNVVIYVTKIKEYPPENYKDGIKIALVSIKRNPKEALNPGMKTGNYLNNVLAKMEANRLGAKDALMLSPSGYLTECTTSNIFFVQGERILTPSLDCGILSGITREKVIQLAQENGVTVEEGQWPAEALEKADELFLTGTIKKIMPVTQLDGRTIGDGKPGPMTQKLIRLYDELLQSLK
ncbi:MAG: aminotransferase class IV [Nitrospinae bacterium]|jgi:branched-chain amino acid aminotransferase|nr:aminotransferase class IV [Nitrospinota bacterium]MDA1108327.1 aminotransferase class IV [Nitrospinota bacterium]